MALIKLLQEKVRNWKKNKKENQGNNKAITINPKYIENTQPIRTNYQVWQITKNIRIGIESESKVFSDLTHEQKKTIDRIINYLEKESMLEDSYP